MLTDMIIPYGSQSSYTNRDRWGNYCEDLTGRVEIHLCDVEGMWDPDFRRYAKHMFEQQVEFQKKMLWELAQFRKEAVMKDIIVENISYREV